MKQMTKQSNSRPARLLVGACKLLLILCATQIAFAQQTTPAHPLPNLATSAAAARPAANAAGEESTPTSTGIKIHGHWVLEVKNPDGKLVERREFDNSLVTIGSMPSGDQVLAALLSGNAVAGDPAIGFIPGALSGKTSDPSLFCIGGAGGCYFYVPDATNFLLGGGNWSPGASWVQTGLSAQGSFGPTVNWVLSGNYPVPGALTSIYAVETVLPLCIKAHQPFQNGYWLLSGPFQARSADIAPSACNNTNSAISSEFIAYATLTFTVVKNGPLTVIPGGVVTVTVTISFS